MSDEIDSPGFPLTWSHFHWSCRVSLKLFGQMAFEELLKGSVHDHMVYARNNLPAESAVNTVGGDSYSVGTLEAALDVLIQELAYDRTRSFEWYCCNDPAAWERVPSSANLRNASLLVHRLGLLMPHISSIGASRTTTINFFKNNCWNTLRGMTFRALFTAQKTAFSPEFLTYVREGKNLSVLRINFADADGILFFSSPNNKACRCATDHHCEANHIDQYCNESGGVCTLLSDCI